MSTRDSTNNQPAIKDEDKAHPIAADWREPLRQVVKAFASGDFGLTINSIPFVAPIPPSEVARIQGNVVDYGESLAELPEETWKSSVSQWMETHWDILVDLWTKSGESDLVLSAQIFETREGFRIQVDSIHVP